MDKELGAQIISRTFTEAQAMQLGGVMWRNPKMRAAIVAFMRSLDDLTDEEKRALEQEYDNG